MWRLSMDLIDKRSQWDSQGGADIMNIVLGETEHVVLPLVD